MKCQKKRKKNCDKCLSQFSKEQDDIFKLLNCPKPKHILFTIYGKEKNPQRRWKTSCKLNHMGPYNNNLGFSCSVYISHIFYVLYLLKLPSTVSLSSCTEVTRTHWHDHWYKNRSIKSETQKTLPTYGSQPLCLNMYLHKFNWQV